MLTYHAGLVLSLWRAIPSSDRTPEALGALVVDIALAHRLPGDATVALRADVAAEVARRGLDPQEVPHG